jgi:hypothetical protein
LASNPWCCESNTSFLYSVSRVAEKKVGLVDGPCKIYSVFILEKWRLRENVSPILSLVPFPIPLAIPSFVLIMSPLGRTGVLILMETAMCLIEANQPIYPLDLTR